MLSFSGYWLPCIIIGISISIDVLIATVSQFHNRSLNIKSWVIPITLTHTIFLAIGYLLFWQAGKGASETTTFILGLTGASFISLLIYEIFCEHINCKPKFSISYSFSNFIEKLCRQLGYNVDFNNRNASGFVRVLAISWDALWIGPAIASNAKIGEWGDLSVLMSFIISGSIVAIVSYSALLIIAQLRKINFHNDSKMAHYLVFGIITELSVIGGFGILSLGHGLNMDINIYQSILSSFFIMTVIAALYYDDFYTNSSKEAEEAISS